MWDSYSGTCTMAKEQHHTQALTMSLSWFCPEWRACLTLWESKISWRNLCLPNATAPLVTIIISRPWFCSIDTYKHKKKQEIRDRSKGRCRQPRILPPFYHCPTMFQLPEMFRKAFPKNGCNNLYNNICRNISFFKADIWYSFAFYIG